MYHQPKEFQSFPRHIFSSFKLAKQTYKQTAYFLIPLTFLYIGLDYLSLSMSGNVHKLHGFSDYFLLILSIFIALAVGMMPLSMIIKTQLYLAEGKMSEFKPLNVAKDIAKRWWSFSSLSFFAALAITLGMILFVVPGVYLCVAFGFALPALLIENKGALSALKSSYSLVHGRWWMVFGRLLLTFFISTLILVFLGKIFFSLGVGYEMHLIGFEIIKALLTPFYAAFYLIFFFNLKLHDTEKV